MKTLKLSNEDVTIGDVSINPETYDGWYLQLDDKGEPVDYWHHYYYDYLTGVLEDIDYTKCFPILKFDIIEVNLL